jgi:tetratricopeptide (TPR) repeat protein
MQLVSRWLADESNGPWLLILDNADEAKMFSPAAAQSSQHTETNLLAYIPQAATGSVLVTSRNTGAALKLVGGYNDIIKIEPMKPEEALNLLKAKLSSAQSITDFRDPDCKKLVAALDNVPLAITQAAAYISQGAPIIDVAVYLDMLYESEHSRTALLDEDVGDLRRDSEVPNAIITTWQISFRQIQRESPDAADLLSLMSVLHRQGIPKSLLLNETSDRLSLTKALVLLQGFSLITANSGTDNSFEMHRLVQLGTKKWLEVHDSIFKWEQKALRLLSKAVPDGDYENWESWRSLLPHVEAVLSYDGFRSRDDLLEQASILYSLSWYLEQKGDFRLAILKIEQALEIYERYLDRKDKTIAFTKNIYGTILSQIGQYDKAEAMYRQALQLLEKVLREESEDHLDTLVIINNLAIVLDDQGKYDEAEAMHRRALQLKEKVLGEEHPDTLQSIDNLAIVLMDQGKYDEAEAMHRRALQLREKVLGEEHPDTLQSINNLAVVLMNQGKYDEAEAMHRRALQLREKVLGEEHPDTLQSINNLAVVLMNQGKYDEAEAMHRRALQLMEKVLGEEHPAALMSMDNLAIVLEEQGKYDEAHTLYQRAISGRRKVLGSDHPYTIKSLKRLSILLEKIKGGSVSSGPTSGDMVP